MEEGRGLGITDDPYQGSQFKKKKSELGHLIDPSEMDWEPLPRETDTE